MTRLFGDPARFSEDAREGFRELHRRHAVGVPGRRGPLTTSASAVVSIEEE